MGLIRTFAATGLAAVLLCACEGASEVQQGAKDYDNGDQEALQKQIQQSQQQLQQQQQQQELLKRLQQDCENTPMLEQQAAPVRAADDGFLPGGAIMFVADMQLAWGGGGGGGGGSGGKGGRPTNCP